MLNLFMKVPSSCSVSVYRMSSRQTILSGAPSPDSSCINSPLGEKRKVPSTRSTTRKLPAESAATVSTSVNIRPSPKSFTRLRTYESSLARVKVDCIIPGLPGLATYGRSNDNVVLSDGQAVGVGDGKDKVCCRDAASLPVHQQLHRPVVPPVRHQHPIIPGDHLR